MSFSCGDSEHPELDIGTKRLEVGGGAFVTCIVKESDCWVSGLPLGYMMAYHTFHRLGER